MDRDTILEQVTSYINQSKSGLEIENPKIDFKSEWYNLNEVKGINEFLKDTSAIANTFGLDGLIIIGFNEKTKTFHNVSFTESGLRDTSNIIGLINKHIDRLFEINIVENKLEGYNISIIHIPPSIDKPHVIRNYQTVDKQGNTKNEENKIFIRKGTSTRPAGKNDLELMYYDRKNIVPEYKILSSFHCSSLDLEIDYTSGDNLIKASVYLVLENIGRRPVSISEIQIDLNFSNNPISDDIIKFKSITTYKLTTILIQPGEIINYLIKFESTHLRGYLRGEALTILNEIRRQLKTLSTSSILLVLSNGDNISSDLTITKD